MPRATQIVPENLFPYQMIVVNDNTEIFDTPTDSGATTALFVFASPKGKDNELQTIDGGLGGFVDEYGIGSFEQYGQPFMNAYACAASGTATLHCLRVTPPDAAYSVLHVTAKYFVDAATGATTVKFYAKGASPLPLRDLSALADSLTISPTPDPEGFVEVKLFSVAYIGRGTFGDNVAIRVATDSVSDKNNAYKNYLFEVYINEGGYIKKEEFQVSFDPDASVSSVSLFADGIVDDPDSGSKIVTMVSYPENFKMILDAYNAGNTSSTFTVSDFDVLLGIDKYTGRAINNYVIDTTEAGVVALNSLTGVALLGGSDGSFSMATPKADRDTALGNAYRLAFSGETDPLIVSRNRYPTNLLLDANYPIEIKPLIANLAIKRGDALAILDCGTGITTKSSIVPYVESNLEAFVTDRVHMIEAYCGMAKDPFNNKNVTVTGTYSLAAAYPANFETYGGKQVPLAGNNFGVLTGFISNTIYPVFDQSIDADMMNELVEKRINFARINSRQSIYRATQTTRQLKTTVLSEANNVFILKDIEYDCIQMCELYEYNFSEAGDIARFNEDAQQLILPKYQESAVRSIGARFDKNAWEGARGIVHLYVEFVPKDLNKTQIIEIDVNRSSES